MFTRYVRRRVKKIAAFIVLLVLMDLIKSLILWQGSPRLIRQPQDLDVLEGGSGRLTCDVNSLLHTEISWSFRDEPIHQRRFESGNDGQLWLRAARVEDGGTYRCTADTLLARITADVQVRVIRRHRRIVIPEADADDMCETAERRHLPAKNIFFIESTGHKCLTARQACSVESAARANPDANVTVHMHTTLLTDQMFGWSESLSNKTRSCRITQRLGQFDRVQIRYEELVEHTRDTPLWILQSDNHYNDSNYPIHHRSDAVRAAILWKYGGIYLDLDCMVLRSLKCLHNTTGMNPHNDKKSWLENGVMSFDAKHPFMYYLMRYMAYKYNPEDYISIGPTALTDAFKFFCNLWYIDFTPSKVYQCINDTTMMLKRHDAFYPINQERKKKEKFYLPDADDADVALLKNSFLVHVYGAGSGRPVPEGSLYGLLAQEYCPTVYAMAIGEGKF